jgi:hypothetical protein
MVLQTGGRADTFKTVADSIYLDRGTTQTTSCMWTLRPFLDDNTEITRPETRPPAYTKRRNEHREA